MKNFNLTSILCCMLILLFTTEAMLVTFLCPYYILFSLITCIVIIHLLPSFTTITERLCCYNILVEKLQLLYYLIYYIYLNAHWICTHFEGLSLNIQWHRERCTHFNICSETGMFCMHSEEVVAAPFSCNEQHFHSQRQQRCKKEGGIICVCTNMDENI